MKQPNLDKALAQLTMKASGDLETLSDVLIVCVGLQSHGITEVMRHSVEIAMTNLWQQDASGNKEKVFGLQLRGEEIRLANCLGRECMHCDHPEWYLGRLHGWKGSNPIKSVRQIEAAHTRTYRIIAGEERIAESDGEKRLSLIHI